MALKAVSHRSDAAEDKLKDFFGRDSQFGVNPVKAQAVTAAELAGNQFMSFFLVLGLFSIAAGVLLIFLIFMMLASERRLRDGYGPGCWYAAEPTRPAVPG